LKTERLQDWLQIVGLLGVIASLIFVGQQMKQDRNIAIGEAWLQYTDTQVSLAQLINDNVDVWVTGLAGEELAPLDRVKFNQIAYAVEQKYAGRYSRSELGVRTGPAQGVALEFAHDLYANQGLRRAVITRWNRLESMTGRERTFFADVRRYLAMIDDGDIEPVNPNNYVH
jgi:hypothetical protein